MVVADWASSPTPTCAFSPRTMHAGTHTHTQPAQMPSYAAAAFGPSPNHMVFSLWPSHPKTRPWRPTNHTVDALIYPSPSLPLALIALHWAHTTPPSGRSRSPLVAAAVAAATPATAATRRDRGLRRCSSATSTEVAAAFDEASSSFMASLFVCLCWQGQRGGG